MLPLPPSTTSIFEERTPDSEKTLETATNDADLLKDTADNKLFEVHVNNSLLFLSSTFNSEA